MEAKAAMGDGQRRAGCCHEVVDDDGQPRPPYVRLLSQLNRLPASGLRNLEERMEAALREMGVTFDLIRNDPWGPLPWACDLLPQIFESAEWSRIIAGFKQRLRAFELFLHDVYDRKEILRRGVIPIHPVLGSPLYLRASLGLPRPQGAYLHLSGMRLLRDCNGQIAIREHHFGHASGISYMMQNRRALARVMPEIFADEPVQSLASTPLAILEHLRETANAVRDPSVVLLTPGPGSAVYFEHSFLARRMGIPLVRGGDLLVLHDRVYLKTIAGLERVDVIYNRLPDESLDPLVFHRDGRGGIPGLVHCLRKGTVSIINGVGSRLADDCSLLCFAQQIIRFYLGEDPLLPTVPTYWLGDLDQRELVLDDIERFHIRSIFGTAVTEKRRAAGTANPNWLHQEITKNPKGFVAQLRIESSSTFCYESGRLADNTQDFTVFALRRSEEFEVFPGALTRAAPADRSPMATDWSSKDTWVLRAEAAENPPPRHTRRNHFPSRQVTSRVAESFYWMGRYLERAHHQAYLIQVVETLETEELNPTERKLYRPMWNRLLPPVDKAARSSKRSIANPIDRYQMVLLPQPGAVVSTFQRAMRNAESLQEALSPEALATLNELRQQFQRIRYRPQISEKDCIPITRRLAGITAGLVPQFFGVASNSMLADDGLRFCKIGQMLERAIITGNSVLSISKSLTREEPRGASGSLEIELSAFLRLLGTRDAYRRIYQMRAEPIPVMEILWLNRECPRSVIYCLLRMASLLQRSLPADQPATESVLTAIAALVRRMERIEWEIYLPPAAEIDPHLNALPQPAQAPRQPVEPLFKSLLDATSDIHDYISDGFLNHQTHINARGAAAAGGFDNDL